LFHWLLVVCVIGLVVTGNMGGDMMTWHARFGFAVLTLVLFRLTWGFWGGHWSRFQQFHLHPTSALTYVRAIRRGDHAPQLGHNPLGAWSVFGMLAIIGWQGTSGLFANDDILTQGPFANMVSSAWSSRLTSLHQFNEVFLYAAIGLHLAAIAFYTYKGQRLIMPMVHGDVQSDAVPLGTAPAQDDWRIGARALLLALTLGTLAWWLIRLAFNAS
jgi:cytochrome b